MLTQCVDRCPDALWTAANPPAAVAPDPDNPAWNGVERQYWRIAFHVTYFTHLYLGQSEANFEAPPPGYAVRRRQDFERMWSAPWDMEPYELPTGTAPCNRADVTEYINFVNLLIDPTVDALDLDSDSSGFSWYPKKTKISHQLMNLCHLQGHIGQLSELLMLQGIDIEWV